MTVAPAKQDCLILALKTTSTDFLSSRIGYNLRVYPGGKYVSNSELQVATQNISLVMDGVERKFWTESGLVNSQSQANPFDFMIVSTGSILLYPFDVHTNTYNITAYEGSNTSLPIPICLQFKNIVENFQVTVTPRYLNDAHATLAMTVQVARNTTTRLFSVFTGLLMWVLGVSVTRFAIDAMSDPRKQIEGPVMGVCIAMLFALPALRNTQPNIPPIGVLSDVYAFFWAELSIIFTGLTQIILYGIRKARESQRAARRLERDVAAAAAGGGADAELGGSGTRRSFWRRRGRNQKDDEEEMDDGNAANAMDIWGGDAPAIDVGG
ncbi:hypothetical protein HK405_014583, partial [Cladochytrium tenue]